ncbi:MAG: hypothetical protein K8R88_13775 [Armatimonadetes bacterium]|nr:hypothetical protein [Armatimonadota bacterium]
MKWPFKKQAPDEAFWDWFQSKNETYKTMQPTREMMHALHMKLSSVNPNLVFQIGNHGGKWQLEISADGQSEFIPAVKQLVGAAPAISDWEFLAFRQRASAPLSIQTPTGSLDSESIFYSSSRAGSKLDIALFIPGLNEQNKPDLGGAVFLLLDSELGEYDVMTKLGVIDFLPLEGHSQQGLQTLTGLRAEIDSLN